MASTWARPGVRIIAHISYHLCVPSLGIMYSPARGVVDGVHIVPARVISTSLFKIRNSIVNLTLWTKALYAVRRLYLSVYSRFVLRLLFFGSVVSPSTNQPPIPSTGASSLVCPSKSFRGWQILSASTSHIASRLFLVKSSVCCTTASGRDKPGSTPSGSRLGVFLSFAAASAAEKAKKVESARTSSRTRRWRPG